MTTNGQSVQIVKFLDDHTCHLDEGLLAEILLNEEVKDLPVVVMSVLGAGSSGKSFLLNFFLRYLTADKSSRADGSWLGLEYQPLTGFSWGNGIKKPTAGIYMWSKPFIMLLPSGEKVAVLLMDTQGTTSSSSTDDNYSSIFALSTLTSSVMIYNLSFDIQESDLEHLQLFNAYAKLMKEKGSTTAFQVLDFLVKDWPYPFNYAYGFEGGSKFLADKLAVTPKNSKMLLDFQKDLTSSFEQISCFLMPHPGFNVLKPSFVGEIREIDTDFRTHLKDFVWSMFSPEKLIPKKINGEQVKARDLLIYFQTYVNLFKTGQKINPTTITEGTTTGGFLVAVNTAREEYEKGMESECGSTKPSLLKLDLEDVHRKYLANAQAVFKARKPMDSQKETDKYLEKLNEDIEIRFHEFSHINRQKINSVILKSKEKYSEIIHDIEKYSPLCVHPVQLSNVHNEAVEAAMKVFNAGRRNISNKKDKTREVLIKSFEYKFLSLRVENERNNQKLIRDIHTEYWQIMETKCYGDTTISENELKQEHDAAFDKALRDFNAKRSLPNSFTEDVYKFYLTKAITDNYNDFKIINKSKSKMLIKRALSAYNDYMNNAWNIKKQCLHPVDLETEHNNAKCQALLVLRPRKPCIHGFDSTNADEQTLLNIISQRYSELQKQNDIKNKVAVQEAFDLYIKEMDDLTKPSPYWQLILPFFSNMAQRGQFHEKCIAKAMELFSSKRRSTGFHYSDPYLVTLSKLINDKYNESYTWQAYQDS